MHLNFIYVPLGNIKGEYDFLIIVKDSRAYQFQRELLPNLVYN